MYVEQRQCPLRKAKIAVIFRYRVVVVPAIWRRRLDSISEAVKLPRVAIDSPPINFAL